MKKLSKVLLALVLWVAITTSVMAQNTRNLTPVKQNPKSNNIADQGVSPLKRNPSAVLNSISNTTAKTSVVSYKTLGKAANTFTDLGSQRHRVAANNATNSIVHIHRATTGTGGSGLYRIDVTTNAGTTFTNDVLIYNNTSSVGNGRYPQVVIHNPAANTNPTNAFAAGLGALTGGSGWNGYGECAAKFDGSTQSEAGTVNSYLIAQTLHEANGVYWAIDVITQGTDADTDSLVVLKGTWNTTTNKIDWIVNNKLMMGSTAYADGYTVQDASIAFAPNGQTGYIMIRGDLAATHPSNTCAPVLWKTTNGGTSWTLINYDMGNMTIPGTTNMFPNRPGGTAPANFFYSADITVDANGKFHIIGAVANAAATGNDPDSTFYLQPNGFKGCVHVWGDGTFVSSRTIDSITTYEHTYTYTGNTPDPTLNENARAQISRTEDGTKVFFVWADDRDAAGKPDIYIQGYNTVTNLTTAVSSPTDLTAQDNNANFHSISATVLGNTGCYEIPVVIAMPSGNDVIAETDHMYVDDAQLCDAAFVTPTSIASLSATEPAEVKAYPNPSTESVNFTYTLNNKANTELSVFALDGRLVSTLTKGNQNAGAYTYTFNRAELPAGVYMARFVVDGKVNHIKVVLQ